MTVQQDRRRFLRNSLAAGAVLGVAGVDFAQEGRSSRGPAIGAAGALNNPRVRPGRVRWHDDFAAACAASGRSGKPVMLFQMLGRMDEKFC
jgi:hypothetical protein